MMDTTPISSMDNDTTQQPHHHCNYYQTVQLYVVQKCPAPSSSAASSNSTTAGVVVDYGRLFGEAAAAETLAYQSAHAHAAAHSEKVRTVPMAQQQQFQQQMASSCASPYGFIAADALFWVRSVTAAVVGEWSSAKGAQVLLGAKHTLWSSSNDCLTSSNSIPTVFCGAGAAAVATQAVRQLPPSRDIAPRVTWWPVGPPPTNAWWKEWRNAIVVTTTPAAQHSFYLPQPGAVKRTLVESSRTATNSTSTVVPALSWNSLMNVSQSVVVATSQQQQQHHDAFRRPAKRRMLHHHSAVTTTTAQAAAVAAVAGLSSPQQQQQQAQPQAMML